MENNEAPIKTEKKKKQNIIWLFIKKNKLKTLLLLFIALVANTYAWFIYNRVVSASMEAHIKSWQVTIEGAIDDSLTFDIDDLYPGMPAYQDEVSLVNDGEMDANLTFSYKSIRIMGDTYTVGVNGVTQQSLQDMIDGYPFEITLEASSNTVSSGGGESLLRLYITWDFGDGDEEKDALDTYWGEKSYEFTSENPGLSSLEIVVDVNIAQAN